MTLANQRVQVAHPTFENSLAKGIIGTAFLVPGRLNSMKRYYLEPDVSIHTEIVKGLLFNESELEEVPG